MIDRAVEHLGEARAGRYLRKFYPWYVTRLGLGAGRARRLQESLAAGRHAGGRQAAAGARAGAGALSA